MWWVVQTFIFMLCMHVYIHMYFDNKTNTDIDVDHKYLQWLTVLNLGGVYCNICFVQHDWLPESLCKLQNSLFVGEKSCCLVNQCTMKVYEEWRYNAMHSWHGTSWRR
jgi:hypothetical protein